MKVLRILVLSAAAIFLQAIMNVGVQAEEDFKNLEVLANNGEALEDGMRELTKGLGVKCRSCHVKGAFESDKLPSKTAARKFIQASLSPHDGAVVQATLDALLASLDRKTPAKPTLMWSALRHFKLKSSSATPPSSSAH